MSHTVSDLTILVHRLLDEYGGGTTYFDALDEALRGPEFVTMTMKVARAMYPDANFVGSGQFAEAAAAQGWDVLVLPGGLRHGAVPGDIPRWAYGRPFVFVDDSFYLGRTLRSVAASLRRGAAYLVGSVVTYDGSKDESRRIGVHSLYRYHH